MGYVVESQDMQCCGVIELNGISGCRNPEEALKDLFDLDDEYDSFSYPNTAPHYIFTQASHGKARTGYGYNLAAYILKHGLGVVSGSVPAFSPKTGNYITVFTWTLDKKAIERWVKRLYGRKTK